LLHLSTGNLPELISQPVSNRHTGDLPDPPGVPILAPAPLQTVARPSRLDQVCALHPMAPFTLRAAGTAPSSLRVAAACYHAWHRRDPTSTVDYLIKRRAIEVMS
jgi:hypothetical protein